MKQGPTGTKGPQGSQGSNASVDNNTNNRVLTATGGTNVNAEANMTFDGSTLDVTGTIRASSDIIAYYSSDRR